MRNFNKNREAIFQSSNRLYAWNFISDSFSYEFEFHISTRKKNMKLPFYPTFELILKSLMQVAKNYKVLIK